MYLRYTYIIYFSLRNINVLSHYNLLFDKTISTRDNNTFFDNIFLFFDNL